MDKNIKERINNEIHIMAYLDAINERVEVARGYINGEYEVNDVDELVTALLTTLGDIEDIKKLIYGIIQNYEKEIREAEYERL